MKRFLATLLCLVLAAGWADAGSLTLLGAGKPGGVASCISGPTPVLLMHNDGTNGSTTFVDSSPSAHTFMLTGGVVLDTSQKQFGTASAFWPASGTNALVVSSTSDFAFGTGDFTLGFWVRFSTINTGIDDFMYDGRSSAATEIAPVIYLETGASHWRYTTAGNTTLITAASGPVVNTWYNVEIDRASGTTTMYINGTSVGSFSDSQVYVAPASAPMLGNGNFGPGILFGLHGWEDEFYIVKGTAINTANFTPNTLPWC